MNYFKILHKPQHTGPARLCVQCQMLCGAMTCSSCCCQHFSGVLPRGSSVKTCDLPSASVLAQSQNTFQRYLEPTGRSVPVKANLSGARIVCFDHWVDIVTSVDASSLEAFGLRNRRCQWCAERACMFPWQHCCQAYFLCLLLCLTDNEDCTTWVLFSEILPVGFIKIIDDVNLNCI